MAKKNTDTVPAMLTPGEFVIKKKSAKKIGYDKLNQMNKTGKVNNKKEAKMPQGEGTYGSKVGRPPKKVEGYAKGGKTKKSVKKVKKNKRYVRNDRIEFDEDMALGGKVKEKKSKRGRTAIPVGGRASKRKGRSTVPVGGRAGKTKPDSGIKIPSSTLGGKKSAPKKGKQDVSKIDDKFSKLMDSIPLFQTGGKVSGGISSPRGGMTRGYSKGGKVTSEGYAVHGASNKYKVGE